MSSSEPARSAYVMALNDAMLMLAKAPRAVFMGQTVKYGGITMSATFAGIPERQLLEFPVAEDLQMGTAIGMSLEGMLPICVYPRWNFLLLAANQLVNHLDRLPIYSKYRPKVIIRVAAPSNSPFYAGPQHDDDFSEAFRMMLRTVDVVQLRRAEDVVSAYKTALHSDGSTLLVEYTEMYSGGRKLKAVA
jgi:pyruvate/2-oxoglutarate/acetoin dehydrogenase E1 component